MGLSILSWSHSALLPALGMVLLAGCGAGGKQPAGVGPADPARRVNEIADEYFRATIEESPLTGLFLGIADAPTDRLDDNSLAAVRRRQQREDGWLRRLDEVPAASLEGHPEAATYATVRELLESSRLDRVCRGELWPLSQLFGWQILFPVVAQLQPVGTAASRADALARWRAIPRYLDTEIVNLREGLRQGYSQPRGNAEAVARQLDELLAMPAATSPLAALADRDSTPGFRDSVLAILERDVLPAARRYRRFLAEEYVPRARTVTAFTALPHGAECYRARLRSYTTLGLDADSVSRLGRAQMEAIEAEIRPIAQRAFGTTDLPLLYQRLRSDSALLFHDRDTVIERAEQAVARAKAAMPRWFGRLPRTDVIVDPCLPYQEESACPNSYVPGVVDGERPARWRVNAGVTPPQPIAPLEATAFHETIPGHHLQTALAAEHTDAHPVSRYFGFAGFDEGWALYAERLATAMGLYSGDLDQVGELSSQALRAARLVVDPGLAVGGWTRRQAIDYMLAHTAESRQYVESEVDRYIATPGQATAYMVGRLEIERLRRLAETRLATKFDVRRFHDQVLGSGSVPLSYLSRHVEAWIEQERAERN